jgi:hypothetical protein
MAGDADEVLVRSEQGKSMLAAGRCNEEIGWASVDSLRAADGA